MDQNIDALMDALARRIENVAGDEGNELFLSRERHVHLLQRAIGALDEFLDSFDYDLALAAQNLHEAADGIGEISGTVVNERILKEIFSNFCIGK